MKQCMALIFLASLLTPAARASCPNIKLNSHLHLGGKANVKIDAENLPAHFQMGLQQAAELWNGSFWVFHGSLTNTPYNLTIKDTTTDRVRTYSNGGTFCGTADTFSFTELSTLEGLGPMAAAATASCSPGPTTACLLSGRFRVEVLKNWWPQGAVHLENKSASFWFGEANTPDVVVKMINGSVVNGRYWVFYGSLTNQSYIVRVTDTVTGVMKTYQSPAAHCGSADTSAF